MRPTPAIDAAFQSMSDESKQLLFAVFATLGSTEAAMGKKESLDNALFVVGGEAIYEIEDRIYDHNDCGNKIFDRDGVVEKTVLKLIADIKAVRDEE